MAAETWINDGSIRRATSVPIHDGTAARNTQQIWIHDGSAARLVFSSASITAPNGSVTHAVAAPTDASAGLSLLNNGTITFSVSNVENITPNAWYTPTTAGAGNAYWVRATLTGGTSPSSGTVGVWLALSSARSWSNSVTTTGTKASDLLIEISTDAGGVVVVSSGTVHIEADAS